jgi:alpha-galactosidase/6-phospho-beta-glucosidase family protein
MIIITIQKAIKQIEICHLSTKCKTTIAKDFEIENPKMQ